MIAEIDARKEGIATQAVKIMVNLAVKEYKKNKIWAKIKDDNFPSIKLFEKLGFVKVTFLFYSLLRILDKRTSFIRRSSLCT